MTLEQINALNDFAKYMDEQRNSITPNMWKEKVVWSKQDAFQQWLKFYLKQFPGAIEYIQYIENQL